MAKPSYVRLPFKEKNTMDKLQMTIRKQTEYGSAATTSWYKSAAKANTMK